MAGSEQDHVGAIAERIRAELDARNWTQAELCRRSGLGTSGLSMLLKRQRKPRKKTVNALAQALGVSPVWLMTGQGDKTAVPVETPPAAPVEPATEAPSSVEPAPAETTPPAPRPVVQIQIVLTNPRVDEIRALIEGLAELTGGRA